MPQREWLWSRTMPCSHRSQRGCAQQPRNLGSWLLLRRETLRGEAGSLVGLTCEDAVPHAVAPDFCDYGRVQAQAGSGGECVAAVAAALQQPSADGGGGSQQVRVLFAGDAGGRAPPGHVPAACHRGTHPLAMLLCLPSSDTCLSKPLRPVNPPKARQTTPPPSMPSSTAPEPQTARCAACRQAWGRRPPVPAGPARCCPCPPL